MTLKFKIKILVLADYTLYKDKCKYHFHITAVPHLHLLDLFAPPCIIVYK